MSEEIRKRNEEMSTLIGLCTPPSLSGELPQSQKDKLPVYTREDMARAWDEGHEEGYSYGAKWGASMSDERVRDRQMDNPYRETKKETL